MSSFPFSYLLADIALFSRTGAFQRSVNGLGGGPE